MADVYIRQGATGNDDGTSWADAYADFPAATLGRGNVYWLADGTYSQLLTLNTAASGSTYPDDWIIIRKATEAAHGAAGDWDTSYGDGQATIGRVTIERAQVEIDGAKRESLTSGHGIKIDNSGASNNQRAVQAGYNASYYDVTAGVYIKYCEIEGPGNTVNTDNFYLYACKGSTAPWTDFKIQYCYSHSTERTHFLIRYCSGLIEHSYFYQNHSVTARHGEAISAVGSADQNGYTNMNNTWELRYNHWVDIEGTGIIVFRGRDWKIHGNLFYVRDDHSTNPRTTNGSICNWTTQTAPKGPSYNCKVFNNTFYNLRIDGSGDDNGIYFTPNGSGHEVKNNIFYNCADVEHPGNSGSSCEYNFNTYYNCTGTHTGEPNSIYHVSDPDFFQDSSSYDFSLTKATHGGQANNLILESPYDRDFDDVKRGWRNGSFDHGAYEYKNRGALQDNPPVSGTAAMTGSKQDIISFPGKGRTVVPGG